MTWEDATMCGQWGQDRILDHLQGRLPAEESSRFLSHAAGCESCRAGIDDLALVARLGEADPIRPGREAEDAVLAAIRARARKPATRRRLRRLPGAPSSAVTVWVFAAAAVFMVALVMAIVSSPPPTPKVPLVRVTPPLPAPIDETPRPEPPPLPVPPQPPAPAPVDPPKPPPLPVVVPKPPGPPPPLPAPEPKPKPPPTETKPAAVEVARVLRPTAAAVLAGEPVHCAAGTMLLETADKSLIALKSGTTLRLEAQGENLTVRLAEGEVVCSVKTRPERRFVVASAHGNVTVKGTVFGVRATSLSSVVAVAKGRVEARTEVGAQDVSAGERSSMSRSTSPGRPEAVNAERLLGWASEAGVSVPAPIWLVAAELQAPMTRGRLAGAISGEPLYAAVDSRTLPGWNGRGLPPNQKEGGWATFTVDVPEAGVWHLWGRFYNPASGSQLWKQDTEPKDNDPNSFYASVDGGKEQVFGNHKLDPDAKISGYRRWYWGGDGAVEVGRPAGLSLGPLTKGRHTIRIRNRDAVETSSLHLAPRVDVLCLTPDKDYRPRDEDFRK